MAAKVRYLFRRHLFLLLGILTLALFLLVAAFDRAGRVEVARALAIPMRVLIVPMYLCWMVLAMLNVALAGPHGIPGVWGAIVSRIELAAGLAPYALVDYLLHWLRRRRSTAPPQ